MFCHLKLRMYREHLRSRGMNIAAPVSSKESLHSRSTLKFETETAPSLQKATLYFTPQLLSVDASLRPLTHSHKRIPPSLRQQSQRFTETRQGESSNKPNLHSIVQTHSFGDPPQIKDVPRFATPQTDDPRFGVFVTIKRN